MFNFILDKVEAVAERVANFLGKYSAEFDPNTGHLHTVKRDEQFNTPMSNCKTSVSDIPNEVDLNAKVWPYKTDQNDDLPKH